MSSAQGKENIPQKQKPYRGRSYREKREKNTHKLRALRRGAYKLKGGKNVQGAQIKLKGILNKILKKYFTKTSHLLHLFYFLQITQMGPEDKRALHLRFAESCLDYIMLVWLFILETLTKWFWSSVKINVWLFHRKIKMVSPHMRGLNRSPEGFAVIWLSKDPPQGLCFAAAVWAQNGKMNAPVWMKPEKIPVWCICLSFKHTCGELQSHNSLIIKL